MTCTIDLSPILQVLSSALLTIPPPLSPSQFAGYFNAIRSIVRSCGASDESVEILTNPRDTEASYSNEDISELLNNFSEPDLLEIISDFESSGFFTNAQADALRDAINRYLSELEAALNGDTIAESKVCAEDDLDGLLLQYTDLIANIYRSTRSIIDSASELGESVSSTSTGLLSDIDSLLAETGASLSDVIDDTCLRPASNRSEIEDMLSRNGTYVVNGRFLVPGNVDTSSFRRFLELVGGLDAAINLLPEIDALRNDTFLNIQTRFIYIITRRSEELVGRIYDGPCVPDGVRRSSPCEILESVSFEQTIAINKSISEIRNEIPEFDELEISEYLFWIGRPRITESVRSLANRFEISEDRIISSVSLESDEDFSVYNLNIANILSIIDVFEDDAESIILRGPPSINISPSFGEIVETVLESIEPRPGARNSCGSRSYIDPSSGILSVIDLNKTIPNELETCSDTSIDLSAVNLALTEALNAPNIATDALARLSSTLNGVLSNLASTMSLIQELVLDRDNLECLKGPDFTFDTPPFGLGPLSTSGSFLRSINRSLQGGISDIQAFVAQYSDILRGIQQLACIAGFVSQSFETKPVDLLKSICNNRDDFANLPVCFPDFTTIGNIRSNIVLALASQALQNLNSFVIDLESIILSLSALDQPTSTLGGGCFPSAASTLVSAIRNRIITSGF